jgi:low affinity Fe/Cu permease
VAKCPQAESSARAKGRFVQESSAAHVLRGKRAMDEWFRRFAHSTAEIVGRSYAFMLAVTIIATWALTGPLFHFTDTWQLVINTGTTIVTFLMVFLIQNTQNRDAHAIHLKLDELIRANKHARNALLGLESMSDDDLRTLQHEFEELRDRVAKARKQAAVRDSRPPA